MTLTVRGLFTAALAAVAAILYAAMQASSLPVA